MRYGARSRARLQTSAARVLGAHALRLARLSTGGAAADKWYYGWNVDITEHEAKDIKKYLCPKCVIEGARKRGGKGTNKRFRTGNAKMSQP